MRLKIVQAGEPSLRQPARPLSADEILSASVQQLIGLMRDTMRDAPGVGLAAPQVGLPLQLAVIEDPPEAARYVPAGVLEERERSPVDFHVVINPRLYVEQDTAVEFFEGCLSVAGYTALVPRARAVRVECLNGRGEATVIHARGWYARILQHEIDHLNGTLYVDRMHPRTFMTVPNYERHWRDRTIADVRAAVGPFPSA